jgi:hypothetical protein
MNLSFSHSRVESIIRVALKERFAGYLRSIEPLIAIVLGCMRWKSAQAHEVRL